MNIVHLKIADFASFIRSKPVVLIHFWAKWNRFDDVVAKTLTELAPLYAETVAIGAAEIDLEEFWSLASELRIKNIPAIAFYIEGKLNGVSSGPICREVVIGLLSREQIEAKIRELLSGSV